MILIIMPAAFRIAFLLYAYLNGSISDHQINELATWIGESEEHQQIFTYMDHAFFINQARQQLLNWFSEFLKSRQWINQIYLIWSPWSFLQLASWALHFQQIPCIILPGLLLWHSGLFHFLSGSWEGTIDCRVRCAASSTPRFIPGIFATETNCYVYLKIKTDRTPTSKTFNVQKLLYFIQ